MPWEPVFLEVRSRWGVMGTHIPISSSSPGYLAGNKCLKECLHLHVQHDSLPYNLRSRMKVMLAQSHVLQPWAVRLRTD